MDECSDTTRKGERTSRRTQAANFVLRRASVQLRSRSVTLLAESPLIKHRPPDYQNNFTPTKKIGKAPKKTRNCVDNRHLPPYDANNPVHGISAGVYARLPVAVGLLGSKFPRQSGFRRSELTMRRNGGSIMHKRFDALLLAVGGGAFGFWLLSGTSVFSSENSSLIVYNGQLDFGEAWAAGDFQWQIRYKNVTNEEIKIERFSISCNCVQCASENLSIPPKADGSLRVKLNLNRAFSGTASGAFQSPFTRGVDANGEGKGFKRQALEDHRPSPSRVHFPIAAPFVS